MENSNIEIKLLTVEEMAKFLKISRSTAYALTKKEGCLIIQVGKCIRINKDLLLNWLHNKNIMV